MYLSRLNLNLRSSMIREGLRDCHALHRTVMAAFPTLETADARSELGVLYRVEVVNNALTLLVQSRPLPDWNQVDRSHFGNRGEIRTTALEDHLRRFSNGQRVRFRLLANPTRKVDTKTGPDGKRRNGRRVHLRTEEDCAAWLQRKGSAGGFEIVSSAQRPGGASIGARELSRVHGNGRGARMTFGGTLFDGELRVIDADVLREAVQQGIGSGKAFGFGLLSLAAPVATG